MNNSIEYSGLYWMNIFLNEYFGFCFELNFELNHFSARFNEKMNFQNVSYRARSNFILLLSASCQSSPGPKHFLISSILFSFYRIQSVLCFDVSCLIIEEQDTNTGVNLQKKSTLWLTNASIQCSQNQVINGSYLSQRFYLQVVRLLCAQADKLKQHILTHSGEKPFKCSHCNFSCTSQ